MEWILFVYYDIVMVPIDIFVTFDQCQHAAISIIEHFSNSPVKIMAWCEPVTNT